MMLERLQKLERRERIGLSIAGVLIALVLLDRLAVRPAVRAARELDVAIVEQTALLALDLGIVAQESRVSDAYSVVEGVVERRVSASAAIDALKARVDELASASGLTIGSMEQRDPRVSEHTENYIVEIGSFEAAVPDLVRFLRGVAALPEATRVSRLTFESDAENRRVRGSMAISKTVLRARI